MSERTSIEVFVPLNQCACHYSLFTQKVFDAIKPHMDTVKVEIKGISSPDGKKYGIKDLSLVVNKEKILPASFKEEELFDLISANF